MLEFFFVDDVTSCREIYFYRGILSGELLFYHIRYDVELFRIDLLKTEIVSNGLKSYLSQKAPKLARAKKLRLKRRRGFSWYISLLERILLKHAEQKN